MDNFKKTIALVSPEELYQRALYCVLSSDGYAVETFPRAGDFAAAASTDEFDCLVIDADLQESHLLARAHLDFAACLRHELPIILVTPEDSCAPSQLALPGITKTTPDSDLLALVYEIITKTAQTP